MAEQQKLFEIPEAPRFGMPMRRLKYPVWTENKAKLIERYLYYFVLVTKHGTYIDGFAGPQEVDRPDMWSAKLVQQERFSKKEAAFCLLDQRTFQCRWDTVEDLARYKTERYKI